MKHLNRILLLNLTIVSFLLSVIYSFIFLNLPEKAEYADVSQPDDAIMLLVLFPVVYMYNLLMSMVQYAVYRFIGKTALVKLTVFNLVGLLIVLIFSFATGQVWYLLLLVTMLVYSIVAVYFSTKK